MPNAVAMANYQTNSMDKKICLPKFPPASVFFFQRRKSVGDGQHFTIENQRNNSQEYNKGAGDGQKVLANSPQYLA